MPKKPCWFLICSQFSAKNPGASLIVGFLTYEKKCVFIRECVGPSDGRSIAHELNFLWDIHLQARIE